MAIADALRRLIGVDDDDEEARQNAIIEQMMRAQGGAPDPAAVFAGGAQEGGPVSGASAGDAAAPVVPGSYLESGFLPSEEEDTVESPGPELAYGGGPDYRGDSDPAAFYGPGFYSQQDNSNDALIRMLRRRTG